MAIAFPIGVGLALVLGVISGYIIKPLGNPWLLFGGLPSIVVAIILDGIAYSRIPSSGNKSVRKGIILSICTGVSMGFFYPAAGQFHFSYAGGPGSGKTHTYTQSFYFPIALDSWLLHFYGTIF